MWHARAGYRPFSLMQFRLLHQTMQLLAAAGLTSRRTALANFALLQVLAVDATCRAISRSARPATGAFEILGRKPGSSGNDGFVLVSCCCGLPLRLPARAWRSTCQVVANAQAVAGRRAGGRSLTVPLLSRPLQLTCAKGASMCDAWRVTSEPRPLASSSGGSKCAAEGKPCGREADCCPLPNFYATASEPARCQRAAATAGQSPPPQQLHCVRRARCSAAGERCGSGAAWSHSNC
jgi:hypothetical protein